MIASSAAFENLVRKHLIAEIDAVTGGQAEISSFHWRILALEAEADGIVIHGTEDSGEKPYAQIDRLRVQMSIFGFFSPHLSLRSLEVDGPRVHLIVYRDGSTNQPRPLEARRQSKSAVQSLFDLRAHQILVERGMLDYDDRASSFDAQNRYLPLDFSATNLSLQMIYTPGSFRAPEDYRVNAAAEDLILSRQLPRKPFAPVHGKFGLMFDLQRNRVILHNLDITAHRDGDQDHMLHVSGTMDDFTHPRWHADINGEFDMRLLDPVTGYADSPEGIAHLHLAANGVAPAFQISGAIHMDNGAYIGTGINATGVTGDVRIDADQNKLSITQIAVTVRRGGQIEGSVLLSPWLPGAAINRARVTVPLGSAGSEEARRARDVLVRPAHISVPMNGNVTAVLKGVSLDTILQFVCPPPFRRLGFDGRANGTASATWSNGDVRTLAVSTNLALSPAQQPATGEVPASGALDATYTQRNGGVDLRNLDLRLPASELKAHGSIGAYPVTSASSIAVDFHSHDLSEFDSVLRSLGLSRNGRSGSAALPVALTGQAGFHGPWTGSLIRPHLAGVLTAAQLAIEMPANGASTQPRMLHLDSVQVDGSYSPNQISIQRAELVRGNSKLEVSGTLDATSGPVIAVHRSAREAGPAEMGQSRSRPGFSLTYDGGSVIHARVDAANIDVADLQPFIAAALPVTGSLNAQFTANGPLRSPDASGALQMDRAVVYGEPLTQIRVQGGIGGHRLKVASARAIEAGGILTASGDYDFDSRTFNIDAHSSDIDIARIAWIEQHHYEAAGRISLDLTGSGSIDDPRLNSRLTVNSLSLGGQRFGVFEAFAHTTGHILAYDATTKLQGADVHLSGQTALQTGYATQARVDFSQFNVGALLRMAHVEAFTADSALAGTISLDGPLANLKELRGDAQIRQLAVNVAGVHLQSDGGLHASLASGLVRLDPLHVTGDNTDLHAQGTVSLLGSKQLDLGASGSINLKLAETLDPDLTASGVTTFQLEAHGPLENPGLQGSVDFQNGSLSLEDLPNGLSQLRGTLEFNQNRLEVKSLTAMTGGGQLTVAGYLAYEHGIFADLSVTGKSVHIRYPSGVSSLADLRLQLQGPQSNLLLSGDVLITRFAVSPDLDLAALALQASSSVQSVAPPNAPSNHVRLDVHVASSPQLNFQNAFAKLAGDVNLRLRGTMASPSLLGAVSITEGSALIAGTRYDLERGDITFTNPVRIEPVIDLSATAHVEDYDISLGLHGSPQKLNVTYRSDPPLPEADVVALLALGHTANQQRLYTQQQEQAISNPTTDALLGGALNATVSSRIQKLFGAGSVKIDPNYLGAFGNSTSRITVEEQLGRNVTLTYATDVNTTSQQLLQAEVAINRHVSLVVARDESGVFSMIVKATRRYR
ncbi:MAG TPA: translocation/assembly module TamB domain-containing protein [Terracidiphilus sp.]|nr:translocation/assembly module TamB domain-containing protein [Terracidiphilus sp.]